MKKLSLGENYTRKCASEDIILTNGGFKHLKQGTYQSSSGYLSLLRKVNILCNRRR